MPPLDPNLETLLARIVPALKPEAVYLIGSRARGDHRPDSDYDLFVVVPDDTPRERRTLAAARQVKRGTGIPADNIPCRRSTFEAKKQVPGTLSFEVWRDGACIYGD